MLPDLWLKQLLSNNHFILSGRASEHLQGKTPVVKIKLRKIHRRVLLTIYINPYLKIAHLFLAAMCG